MLDFLMLHKEAVLLALLAVSEVMALIPSIKSSGIFDLLYRSLKALAGKKDA